MIREPFSIHPALEAHIDPLSEEESRLLEESIASEGCRDPLVVWREENVLVDGHNRKRICDALGVPFQVVYRSFPDIEAVKSWMDLNQLGRRNLTREKRDEMIRRLAASGVRQKEIAEKVGLTKAAISHIVGESKNLTAPPITTPDLTVTAKLKDEIEALRRLAEAEKARAGKNEVLLKNAREQEEKAKAAEAKVRSMHEDALEKYREALEDLETHKRELRRLQAAPPQVAERVVEVVKEVQVIPPEVQERIAALEKEQSRVTPPTTEKPDQTPTAKAIAQGLRALHAAAQEGGLGDIATVLWKAATQVEELMRRPAA